MTRHVPLVGSIGLGSTEDVFAAVGKTVNCDTYIRGFSFKVV